MPAFQHSIDLGYTYLETDVHLSADGVLFAFHDSNLLARTGTNADFGDLDASEIDALRVDGTEPIPRFDAVMSAWPAAKINIDAKSDAAVMPLIDAVRAHRAVDRVCLSSFSDRRVKAFRKAFGPGLCTSMGQAEAARLFFAARGLADPSLIRAACAQLPTKSGTLTLANEQTLAIAHELDIQVHFWTINDRTTMTELIQLGADGIMTDRPRMLREVLIEHDLWLNAGVHA